MGVFYFWKFPVDRGSFWGLFDGVLFLFNNGVFDVGLLLLLYAGILEGFEDEFMLLLFTGMFEVFLEELLMVLLFGGLLLPLMTA